MTTKTATIGFCESEDMPVADMSGSSRRFIEWRSMLALLAFSINMWLLTAATTKFHRFPPNALHYAQTLPVSYWIGLVAVLACFGLLAVASNRRDSRRHKDGIVMLSTAILVVYVFATPGIVYDTTRFNDVYKVVDGMEAFVSSGRFDLGGNLDYASAYPGALTFFFTSSSLLGIPLLSYARFHPAVIVFGMATIAWAIGRRLNVRRAALTPPAVVAFAWPQEFHMAPQSVGVLYVGLLLLLFVLTHESESTRNSVRMRISVAVFVLVAALTIAHPGSPLVLLFSLAFSWLVMSPPAVVKRTIEKLGSRVFRSGSWSPRWETTTSLSPTASILLLAMVMWLAWLLYVAQSHFLFLTNYAEQALLNLLAGEAVIYNSSIYGLEGTPQSDLIVVYGLRIGLTVLELMIALTLISFRFGTIIGAPASLVKGWTIGALVLIVSGVLGGGFFTGRALIFLIIPVSVLLPLFMPGVAKRGGQLDSNRSFFGRTVPHSLLAVVLVAVVLTPATVYGGDPFEFRPQSSLALRTFAAGLDLSVSNLDVDFGLNLEGPLIAYDCYVFNGIQERTQKGVYYVRLVSAYPSSRVYDSGCSSLYVRP